MKNSTKSTLPQPPRETDVIIIGAGPLGIELAILLKRADIDFIHLEANQIGHTIYNWPKNTQFFSSPERVALAGVPLHTPTQQSVTGDMYLAYLRSIVERNQLSINTYEPVTNVTKLEEHGFLVETKKRDQTKAYRCQKVVFAIGNMNRPKMINCDGEDYPFVHHRLKDPHLYFGTNLLIVGGKNSALEAALRCWRAGAHVTLSYRRDKFDTTIVKPHLAKEIRLLIRKKQIRFYKETVPEKIDRSWATLAYKSKRKTRIPIDFVLMCIGYEADASLYQKLGIQLAKDDNRPLTNPDTMETSVPNTYVCGTTAGGNEKEHNLFIATCHIHAQKIFNAITGKETPHSQINVGTIASRSYPVDFEEIKQS